VAENLTRQILKEHLVDGDLDPGEPIGIRVDQTLLQDATGTMAFMQFEQLEVPRVEVSRAVQYIDHNVVALDFKNPDDHRFLRALCRRHGVRFSRPGKPRVLPPTNWPPSPGNSPAKGSTAKRCISPRSHGHSTTRFVVPCVRRSGY